MMTARDEAVDESGERLSLCELPPELLMMVLASPAISARDLLALELTCSLFHRRHEEGAPGLSLVEQAAKNKLRHRFGCSSASRHKDKGQHNDDGKLGSGDAGTNEHSKDDADADDGDVGAPPSTLFRLIDEIEAKNGQESSSLSTTSTGEGGAINMKYLVHHLLEEPPVPTFVCPCCQWHVAGFRCGGHRPPRLVREWVLMSEYREEEDEGEELAVPAPTGCGCHLMWNAESQRLSCPLGCGSIGAPVCSCRAYEHHEEEEDESQQAIGFEPRFQVMNLKQESDPGLRAALAKLHSEIARPVITDSYDEDMTEEINQMWDDYPPIKKKTPWMSCTRCGYTITDYACLGKSGQLEHPPRRMFQAGFYERVWCSYRFSCAEPGCSVIHGGAEAPDDGGDDGDDAPAIREHMRQYRAFLCCTSRPECFLGIKGTHTDFGTEMATLDWVDTLGPATNYEGYCLINRKRPDAGQRRDHLD